VLVLHCWVLLLRRWVLLLRRWVLLLRRWVLLLRRWVLLLRRWVLLLSRSPGCPHAQFALLQLGVNPFTAHRSSTLRRFLRDSSRNKAESWYLRVDDRPSAQNRHRMH
jgi:hypothetical protein